MTEAEFPQMWESAIALAEIRGWIVRRFDKPAVPCIHIETPLDDAGVGSYMKTLYYYQRDLKDLLSLLENGPPTPVSRARYSFGFTDPKEIYGRTIA